MLNQKIFKSSIAETIEDFPIDEWKKLKTTAATLISFKMDDEKSLKCEVMFTMKATSLPEFPASFKFCSIFTVRENDIVSVSSVFKCFEKAVEQITSS